MGTKLLLLLSTIIRLQNIFLVESQISQSGYNGVVQDEWLLAIVAQLSPRVSELGAEVLNSKVAPVAEKALAALKLGKKAFKFTKIQLGSVKPELYNLRTHKKNKDVDRIVVDFDMSYLGDNDIQAELLTFPVGIKNVKFSGKMRVVMNPTMSQLPFIGGVQIMFLNPPEIDFDFEGAARIASKLPIVKTKIKSELLEDMGKEIIFPNRLTLPLSWTADPELVWHGQVTGILAVRLKSVKGLPKKGSGNGLRKMFGQDKPDVYGVLNIGSVSHQTRVVKNSQEASFSEVMEWMVEEIEGHVLEVNIFDKDSGSSDEFLGYSAVDLSSMTQIAHHYNAKNKKGTKNQLQPNVIR